MKQHGMKNMCVMLAIVASLAGCLPGVSAGVVPADGHYRELTLYWGGGLAPWMEHYTYVPATRELTKVRTSLGAEAPTEDKVQLSQAQATELEDALAAMRLDTGPRPTSCPTDAPVMGFDYVDVAGKSWSYSADRHLHCEDSVPAKTFVEDKEFSVALNFCKRFLP